jgi:hypothetical protein
MRDADAKARVRRELRENPYRSDRVVAEAAGTQHQRVSTWRRQLERDGVIERVPVADRARGRDRRSSPA